MNAPGEGQRRRGIHVREYRCGRGREVSGVGRGGRHGVHRVVESIIRGRIKEPIHLSHVEGLFVGVQGRVQICVAAVDVVAERHDDSLVEAMAGAVRQHRGGNVRVVHHRVGRSHEVENLLDGREVGITSRRIVHHQYLHVDIGVGADSRQRRKRAEERRRIRGDRAQSRRDRNRGRAGSQHGRKSGGGNSDDRGIAGNPGHLVGDVLGGGVAVGPDGRVLLLGADTDADACRVHRNRNQRRRGHGSGHGSNHQSSAPAGAHAGRADDHRRGESLAARRIADGQVRAARTPHHGRREIFGGGVAVVAGRGELLGRALDDGRRAGQDRDRLQGRSGDRQLNRGRDHGAGGSSDIGNASVDSGCHSAAVDGGYTDVVRSQRQRAHHQRAGGAITVGSGSRVGCRSAGSNTGGRRR